MPALFRHREKRIILNVHVDDELMAASAEDGEWLLQRLKEHFTLSATGPVPVGEKGDGVEELLYLKKRYVFTEGGIFICPHQKYFKNLREMLDFNDNTTTKPTPEHPNITKQDNSEPLSAAEQTLFRSALGT